MSFEQPTPIRQPLLPIIEPETSPGSVRLPTPLSTFIGRQQEIDHTAELIRSRKHRLLTLTGPGGVGKTRLALIAAAEVAGEFRDGVDFVNLSSVYEPELVLPTIAHALRLRRFDEQSTLDALRLQLRQRRQLLVLDNFEQVIDAAPQITSLLMDCPELVAIVTSRAALHVSGEQIVPVQPLTLPVLSSGEASTDLGELAANEAVRLFVERTRAVRPGFVLTAENAGQVALICARVDGLPLAIELAAARGALISLNEMLDRLERRLPLLAGGARDLPARQQTMRDTIAWSYDLLTDREQATLRCLSVFAGGWRLDAAEAVCGPLLESMEDDHPAGSRDPGFLAVIESLARQCLIQVVSESTDARQAAGLRMTMLETVREFATEERRAHGDDGTARRHANWYRAMVASAEPTFWGDEPGDWRAAIEAELGNILAAMIWAMEHQDADTALQLASALLDPQWMFNYEWLASDDSRWHQNRVQQALSLPGGTPEHRVKALIIAACLAEAHEQQIESTRMFDDAISLARANDDVLGLATAAFFRGRSAYRRSELDEARRWMSDAQTGFRSAGARGRMAWALCFLASLNSRVAIDEGGSRAELEEAATFCDEALAVFRSAGHIPGIQRSMHGLAYAAYKLRDYPRSLALIRELIELALDNDLPLYDFLDDVADIAGRTGHPEIAARLYGAAMSERLRHGSELPPVFQGEFEQEQAIARRALGDGPFETAWEDGRLLPIDRAVEEAMAFASTGLQAKVALTPRERQILPLLAQNMTAREIGAMLFLSHRTVENHIANFCAKLGVRTRGEAVEAAQKIGLIDPPPDPE